MKVKLQLTLEGEDALAFQKAHEAWVARCGGVPPHHSESCLARFLLARASSTYATAPADTLTRWWKFDLRLVTPEEKALDDLLREVARHPS